MNSKEGSVLAIFVCPNKGQEMAAVSQVDVVKERGIVGDRYAEGRGAYSNSKIAKIRDVSFISVEDIIEVNETREIPFKPWETRRNFITMDIDLRSLIGRNFMVGGIAMLGIEACDPCDRPDKLSGKSGFKEVFTNRGGLRARVLDDGRVLVCDPIYLLD
jgi:MOSC domain-containing protein YiiM